MTACGQWHEGKEWGVMKRGLEVTQMAGHRRSLQGSDMKEEPARRSQRGELSSERAPPGKKELWGM